MDGVLSRSAPRSPRGREHPHAGGSALSILASPLNARVLVALTEGPRPSERLREALGSPPRAELRNHLAGLTRIGLLERTEREDSKGTVVYDLAGPGQDLLRVGEVLEAWLVGCPRGRLSLGTAEASAAVRALVQAWAADLVRAVAATPCSATELAKLFPALRAPVAERHLGALRDIGLLDDAADGGAPRYAPTDWLRRSVAPLAAGASWERRHLPSATRPIDRHDVENAFLLSLPLLRLRPSRSGRCRLAVALPDSTGESVPVGVLVEVCDGEVVTYSTRLTGPASGWALGSPRAWLLAVIEGEIGALQLGGDEDLATDLAWGLHTELYGLPQHS